MEPCTTNTNSALKVYELITLDSLLLQTICFLRHDCFLILLMCSIQALLSAPNPDDPLSENIAKHWKNNEAEAVETGNMIQTTNSEHNSLHYSI